MPGVRLSLKCIICKVRTTPKTRRKINAHLGEQIRQQFSTVIQSSDVICNKCRHKYFYNRGNLTECNVNNTNCDAESIEDHDTEFIPPTASACPLTSPPSLRLNIPSTPKSHSRCFICKRPGLCAPGQNRQTDTGFW